MIRLALLLALLPATAAAGAHPAKPGNSVACDRNRAEIVADPGRAGFHRLDQLPPANEQLTLLRTIDGCQKPVIVRYGIGGNPQAAASPKP